MLDEVDAMTDDEAFCRSPEHAELKQLARVLDASRPLARALEAVRVRTRGGR